MIRPVAALLVALSLASVAYADFGPGSAIVKPPVQPTPQAPVVVAPAPVPIPTDAASMAILTKLTAFADRLAKVESKIKAKTTPVAAVSEHAAAAFNAQLAVLDAKLAAVEAAIDSAPTP